MKNLIFAGVFLLIGPCFLAWDASRKLSPTWDEIIYPTAGYAQTKTGKLNLDIRTPFLSRLFLGIPLHFLPLDLPLDHPSWEEANDYRFAFQFIFRNKIPAQKILGLSRLVSVFFFFVTGLLLFYWINQTWGREGGFLAVISYSLTPIFLSRASLAHLEMPMFFFMLLSLWLHHRWASTDNPRFLVACGITGGLALLCKLVALPLIPTFFVLEIFFSKRKRSFPKKLGFFAIISLIMGVTLILAYLPWEGGTTAIKELFRNIIYFNKGPYFWNGGYIKDAPALLSWGAFLIKAPLIILLTGLGGLWVWKRSRKGMDTYFHFLVLSAACFISILFTKNAVSTIQISPVYFGIVAGAAAWAPWILKKKLPIKLAVVGLILLAGVDTFQAHPNHLAYFNPLVGGPQKGHQWLADSDQDWGQSLPALKKYLDKNPADGILLSYSGSADPQAYGISYQDFFSPGLVTAERADWLIPLPAEKILFVVSTKVLQSYPEIFGPLFQIASPQDFVGFGFFVFDFSDNSKVYQWMGEIYTVMGRRSYAQWASNQVEFLSSN